MRVEWSVEAPISASAVAQSTINGATLTFQGYEFQFPNLPHGLVSASDQVDVLVRSPPLPFPVSGDEWEAERVRVESVTNTLLVRLTTWLPPVKGRPDARLGSDLKMVNVVREPGEKDALPPQSTSSLRLFTRVFEANVPLDVLAASEVEVSLATVLEVMGEISWPTSLGEKLRGSWRIFETISGTTTTKTLATWCGRFAAELNTVESGWSTNESWWEAALDLRHRYQHADKRPFTAATVLSASEVEKAYRVIKLAHRAGEAFMGKVVSTYTPPVSVPLP